jgi:hypothetical protein
VRLWRGISGVLRGGLCRGEFERNRAQEQRRAWVLEMGWADEMLGRIYLFGLSLANTNTMPGQRQVRSRLSARLRRSSAEAARLAGSTDDSVLPPTFPSSLPRPASRVPRGGDGCPGVLPVAGGEVPDGGGGRGGGGAGGDRGRQGARRRLQAQPQRPRVRQPLPRHEQHHTPLLPPRGQGKHGSIPHSLPLFYPFSSLFSMCWDCWEACVGLGVTRERSAEGEACLGGCEMIR